MVMVIDKYKRVVDSTETLVPELVGITNQELDYHYVEEYDDYVEEFVSRPYALLNHMGVGGFSFIKDLPEEEGGEPNIPFENAEPVADIVAEFGEYNSMHFMPTAGLNIQKKEDYIKLLNKIYDTKNSTLVQAYLREYLFIRGYIKSTFKFNMAAPLFTGKITASFRKNQGSGSVEIECSLTVADTQEIIVALMVALSEKFKYVYSNHANIIGLSAELIETLPNESNPDEPIPIFAFLNNIEFTVTPQDTLKIKTLSKSFTGSTSDIAGIPSMPARDDLFLSIVWEKPCFTGTTHLSVGNTSIATQPDQSDIFKVISDLSNTIKEANDEFKCRLLTSLLYIDVAISLITDDPSKNTDGSKLKVTFISERIKEGDEYKDGISISVTEKNYEADLATIPNPEYRSNDPALNDYPQIENPYQNNVLRFKLSLSFSSETYESAKLSGNIKIYIGAFADYNAIDQTLSFNDMNVPNLLKLLIDTINGFGDHYVASYDWQPLQLEADYGWQDDETTVEFTYEFNRQESKDEIINPAELTITHSKTTGMTTSDGPLLKDVDYSKLAAWDGGNSVRDAGFIGGPIIARLNNPEYNDDDRLAAEADYKAEVPEKIENPEANLPATIENPNYNPNTQTIENPNYNDNQTIGNPNYQSGVPNIIDNPDYDENEAKINPYYSVPSIILNPNWAPANLPNPDYDTAESIINPDYSTNILERIPNPSLKLPKVLINSEYKPEQMINPNYDAAPTIINPYYDPYIPEIIPNPDYDPTIPETIPNPDYDPQTNPNVPETIINPEYNPNIPKTIPNPDLEIPIVIDNPDYDIRVTIPNPFYKEAPIFIDNPEYSDMIPNPNYDLNDAYNIEKDLEVIENALPVNRGLMIYRSGEDLMVANIFSYRYVGPYRPDLPRTVPNPNYDSSDPDSPTEIPNPDLRCDPSPYYKPLTYVFSVKVDDLFKDSPPYNVAVYDDMYISDYNTLVGFWGGDNFSKDGDTDMNFFCKSPNLSRTDLYVYIPYNSEGDPITGYVDQYDIYKGEIKTTTVATIDSLKPDGHRDFPSGEFHAYDPEQLIPDQSPTYPDKYNQYGDINYGKPRPLKAWCSEPVDGVLELNSITENFEDSEEGFRYLELVTGEFPIYYKNSEVFKFVEKWDKNTCWQRTSWGAYTIRGDYVPMQRDGRRFMDFTNYNSFSNSMKCSVSLPKLEIMQTIPRTIINRKPNYLYLPVPINQIYSEIPICFDTFTFAMTVIECLKYPDAICFFVFRKVGWSGMVSFINRIKLNPFDNTIVDNFANSITKFNDDEPDHLEIDREAQKFQDDAHLMKQQYAIAKAKEEEKLKESEKQRESDPNIPLYVKDANAVLAPIKEFQKTRYEIIANNFASWDLIFSVYPGYNYYYISF